MARHLGGLWLSLAVMWGQHYAAPAGERPAVRPPSGPAILPGGRVVAPLGTQHITGPGPYGMAISPDGRTVVTANSGPERFSFTVVERQKNGQAASRHYVASRQRRGEKGDGGSDENDEWRSVFMGLAFADAHTLYASEGNSGRVRLIDARDGQRKRDFRLNRDGFQDSYTGDLAVDSERHLLYVVDQANFRLVSIDLRKNTILSTLRLGRLPFAVALSPDRRRVWVTHLGMFEYQPVPGADRTRARETGLPFPAFGFPSAESRDGAQRETAGGARVQVPGLGDPNVRESNSVVAIDVANPAAPKVEAFLRTGLPVGPRSVGGSSPSGVLAAGERVYVTNGHNDSVSVIDAKTLQVIREIPLRIQGLDRYRGLLPLGMAFHESTGWLLVALAGANSLAVIDTKTDRPLGVIPTGWFPARVAIDRDNVYVTNVKGNGTGPNAMLPADESFTGVLRRGSVSIFPLPASSELASLTARVFSANGFVPRPGAAGALPSAVRHVVVIVKENRTFDEVFGDIERASNGPVLGLRSMARWGRKGWVSGRNERFSVSDVNVTPNHHALAEQFAFSDNFYADSEVSVDGHHWLAGSYPDAWTETTLSAAYAGQKDFRLPTTAPGRLLYSGSNSSVHPEELLEAGALWHHLERHGIPFRNFGEGFELAGIDEGKGLPPTGARVLTNVPMPDPLYRNTSRTYPGYNTNIPDQFRATQFIREIEERTKAGQDLPRFIFIHLPNDHIAAPRPEDGYPYDASFVSDNDYALGRIVDFLSHTRWWKQMAIFVTEDDAQGGKDHIDSHRTVLLGIGPYCKRNYVSHVNASFPGMLKTCFRLLGLPPLNLFDAVASDLSDMFTDQPGFAPYRVEPVDARIFVTEKAREPMDPKPVPAMDDPRVLREQHRRQ